MRVCWRGCVGEGFCVGVTVHVCVGVFVRVCW